MGIIWFGVIAKHGCCCAIACCCLGKPNILATAIAEGIFTVYTVMRILQALSHGHVLLVLAAVIVFAHLVTQAYLTAEAFMVWLKNREAPASSQETVVGPPVILGQKASTSEKQGQAASGDVKGKEHAAEDQASPV